MEPIRIDARRFASVALGLVLGAVTGGNALAAGYQVSVNSAPGATSGGYANCSYNYAGHVGGFCDLRQTGVGTVTPADSTGTATAAATSGDNSPMSTIHATVTASADLTTASLHLYELDTGTSKYFGGYAGSTAYAALSDTLHYTVAGATASTETPIEVSFTVEGLIKNLGTDTGDDGAAGEVNGAFLFGAGDARFDLQNNVTTGYSTIASLDTYPSAYPGVWTTNADHTVNTFTAIYDVKGATGDLAIGANAHLSCENGYLCDFSHTFLIGLTGPADFSYTSASGVFLTGGAVPEPATWAIMLAGFGGLGAAMRSRRRVATSVTA